ncbi:secreted RxLR effector protein 78-like [Nicotiana tomentosiformis]|uniref:secreted RxLR effector protein 78-like n=1 Tax=Nicotiana tomentosiformis TaxID=4098 RepID=UPI00388C67B9
MAKAYDRMSWSFLVEVLKRFGFDDHWIDMIWRMILDVWYSIIINGTRRGFFTSSQGLKQGDPISPSLFILAAEVLSRSLNALHESADFVPFTMSSRDPLINHLVYADDIVIFTGGNNRSVKLIMKQIRNYETSSG